mmetsp:Transcript_35175/g.34847  ORF Transcript_35175/g.34847 Transcript_35175/m.34847 type:complete len:103 (-) Transcript_35175:109-417(-)
MYVDCLKTKLDGITSRGFRETLKRHSFILKSPTKFALHQTLLNSEVLQDEDIRLFVSVIPSCPLYPRVNMSKTPNSLPLNPPLSNLNKARRKNSDPSENIRK